MPTMSKKKAPVMVPTLPTDPQSFAQHVQAMHAKSRDFITMECEGHMEEPSVVTSSGSTLALNKSHLSMHTWATYGITHFDVNTDWDPVDDQTQMPLENVRLDDQGVFWAIATMGPKERNRRFSYDFDSHAGSWCTATGYMLQKKVPRNAFKTKVSNEMSLGFVLAPPAAVEASKAFSSMTLELRTGSSVSYDPDTTKGIIDVGALTGNILITALSPRFQPSVAAGETPTFSDQDFASQGFQNTAGNTFVNVAIQIGTPDPQDSPHHSIDKQIDDSMGTDMTMAADKALTKLGWWIVDQDFSTKDMETIRSRVSQPATKIDFLISNIREGDSEEILRALSLSSKLQDMSHLITHPSGPSDAIDTIMERYCALRAASMKPSIEEFVQRP
ncbi:hypothetical protein N7451_000160 [Penicillium sp. IBT 35674x]|nr:hypothetical protein N7451_000160 [Penicillium sp. IBT 35674x]